MTSDAKNLLTGLIGELEASTIETTDDQAMVVSILKDYTRKIEGLNNLPEVAA